MSEKKSERILPTEPGAWWVRFGPSLVRPALVNRISLPAILGMGPTQVVASLPGHQTEAMVDLGGFTWLCRIPTPEELAAQAAALAAGQALADHLRRVDAQYRSRVPDTSQREAFLAAFPPLATSPPPAIEPPSPQIVDLAAALRASMARKGGAR